MVYQVDESFSLDSIVHGHHVYKMAPPDDYYEYRKNGYYGRAATISLCSSSSEVSIQEWLLNRVRRLFKQTHFMVMNRHYIKPKNDKNWGFHDQDGQSCSFNAITICCCLLRMLSKKGTKEFIYDKV